MKLKLWHTAFKPEYDNKIHPRTLFNIKNWVKLNPKIEIDRHIVNDKEASEFLLEFDEKYKTKAHYYFHYEEDGRFKSDLFRMCAIFDKGGMYIDIDQTPLGPFDSYFNLEEVDFLTGVLAPSNYICNGILYAKEPQNHIIKSCLMFHLETYRLKINGVHKGDMSAIHTMCKTIRSMFKDRHIPENNVRLFNYDCIFVQEIEGKTPSLNCFHYDSKPFMMTRYHGYYRDKQVNHEHVEFTGREIFNVR